MKKQTWKTYGLFILAAEGVGALAGWLTRNGTVIYQQTVRQPPLSPPGWVFPVVWTLLYALMGWSMARVWLTPASQARQDALRLWCVQLAVNFFWPVIFFSLRWFGGAFVWLVALWVLCAMMTAAFAKADAPAAKGQAPYLLWLTFALYLNLGVWLLNR